MPTYTPRFYIPNTMHCVTNTLEPIEAFRRLVHINDVIGQILPLDETSRMVILTHTLKDDMERALIQLSYVPPDLNGQVMASIVEGETFPQKWTLNINQMLVPYLQKDYTLLFPEELKL